MHTLFIGNAIVDLISHINYEKLLHPDDKGKMKIISLTDAEKLQLHVSDKNIIIGGSANNSACGLSIMDEEVCFIGKIGNDKFGEIYKRKLKDFNLVDDGIVLDQYANTGRSIIYVTPDGERTMNTYLGASVQLTSNDIQDNVFKNLNGTFIEGYIYYLDDGKNIIEKSFHKTKEQHGFTAISLSDVNCVEQFRSHFFDLIYDNKITLLFGNKSEMMSLFEAETEANLIKKMTDHSKNIDSLIMTSGNNGATVINNNKIYNEDSIKVENILDTTGAGDLFVSGYIKAYLNGKKPDICLKCANYLASQIIRVDGGKLDIKKIKEYKEGIYSFLREI
jgi:sugar/nucleoside kinase (ribokinase family)